MAPLDFDESDLTELDYSEDDSESDVPLSKSQSKTTSAKGKGKAKEYTILKKLRPPRTTQYTAKSLYGAHSLLCYCVAFSCAFPSMTDQIIDNTVDLDPEYQRGKLFFSLPLI